MDIDWSKIKHSRNSVKGMFPRVLKVPIVPDANEKLYDIIPEGGSLLDVGAYDRNVERFLAKKKKRVVYKSLDVDRTNPHDYHSFDDVKEKFDAAVCFEVVEHLDVREAVELLAGIHGVLKDGGRAIISTPNVFHPTIFWRDCTHRTGFRYNELAGMMRAVGFGGLEVYRVAKMSLKDRLTFLAYKPLFKLLNIDFAGRIIVIGERK